jgi:hypothetical protein
MKIASMKRITIIFCLIGSANLMLLLFTNMTSGDVPVEHLLAESKKASAKLSEHGHSNSYRKLVLNHKRMITGQIAARLRIQSCTDLLNYDNTTVSGVYTLFPTGDISYPVLYKCVIKNKILTAEKKIKEVVISSICDQSKSCFESHRKMTFESDNSSVKNYSVPGVRGMPELLQKLSSVACRPNVDFGFELDTVWVKNGCGGIFNVPLGIPLRDKVLSGASATVTPIKGNIERIHVNDGNLNIYGWACELHNKKAVTVQLYAEDGSGLGTFIGSGVSDFPNGKAVDSECETEGVGHRFRIEIPSGVAIRFVGKKLNAYGISSSSLGTNNGVLTQSGKFVIPTSGLSLEPFILQNGISKNLGTPESPYFLRLQANGNLGVFKGKGNSSKMVWSSDTANKNVNCSLGCMATFQSDGNFVLYRYLNASKTRTSPYWNSRTYGMGVTSMRFVSEKPFFKFYNKNGAFVRDLVGVKIP